MSSDLSQHKPQIHRPKIHWIGAGLASGPGIISLANQWGKITVWDMTLDRAEALKAHVSSDSIMIISHLNLENDISRAQFTATLNPGDVIISMLPAGFHPQVARIALAEKCHMVTSSYLSDDMRALDEQATSHGLCIVNEVGLDPGIDHLLTHILVDAAHKTGLMDKGNIIDFISYCGGIPAGKTPFTYKFSWTPLGVLSALTNPSKMIKNGKEHTVLKAWDEVTELSLGGEGFEVYANRDSLPYVTEYGLDQETGLRTFVRGTLRLKGWKEAWKGIFNTIEKASPKDLKDLSDTLWQKHHYNEGEQDRVVLHVAMAIMPKGGPEWRASLSLDIAGTGWQSAMASTVSLTVVEAALAVLKGRLPPGVQAAPHNIPEAQRWLKGLAQNGIKITADNITLAL